MTRLLIALLFLCLEGVHVSGFYTDTATSVGDYSKVGTTVPIVGIDIGALGTRSFSISLWTSPRTWASASEVIAKDKSGDGSAQFRLELQLTGRISYSTNLNGPTSTGTSNIVIPLNFWTHILFVRGPSAVNVYVNGTLDKTFTGAAANHTNTYPLNVGTRQPTGSNPFDGTVCTVLLFWKVLSLQDAQTLFQTTADRPALGSGTTTLFYPGSGWVLAPGLPSLNALIPPAPACGPNQENRTMVTVVGTNFMSTPGTACRFNQSSFSVIQRSAVLNSSIMLCSVPSSFSGNASVEVSNDGVNFSAQSANLEITSLSSDRCTTPRYWANASFTQPWGHPQNSLNILGNFSKTSKYTCRLTSPSGGEVITTSPALYIRGALFCGRWLKSAVVNRTQGPMGLSVWDETMGAELPFKGSSVGLKDQPPTFGFESVSWDGLLY